MELLHQANAAFQQNRLHEAIRLYQEAITRYPELASIIQFNCTLAAHRANLQHDQAITGAKSPPPPQPNLLRLLFVLPNAVDSNNGYHVQLLARMLESSGTVHCTLTTPDIHHRDGDRRTLPFSAVTAQNPPQTFDLIHAWTPREVVREMCEELLKLRTCPLVVHLEDNEEYLTSKITGRTVDELAKLEASRLNQIIPRNCYHPAQGKRFLQRAQGITMIIDTLCHFKEAHIPGLVIAPPVDERLFSQRPINYPLRREMGIADDQVVLVYSGNVHAGNIQEVQELYEAVKLLNRRGIAALLLRTGRNPGTADGANYNRQYERYLGWVEREQVPDIVAAADVLVQPGKPGLFNDQRIPCKLPEFFALGRPVILPRTNIGLKVLPQQQGVVLENADAHAIADAVATIMASPSLWTRLATGALEFYQTNFTEQATLPRLLDFYTSLTTASHSSTIAPKGSSPPCTP